MSFNGLATNRYIGNSPQYGYYERQPLTPDSTTTIFTLDFLVASAAGLLVVLNGVVQQPDVDYDIISGGTQIEFDVAPPAGQTLYVVALGQVLILPTASSYLPGSINPGDINSNYSKSLYRSQQVAATSNLTSQFMYYVNTSGGAITLTLPAAPVFGDKIWLIDMSRALLTNPCTINRNGKLINSVAANYVMRVNNSRVTLEFINNIIGWKLTLETDQEPQDGKLFFLGS